MYSTQFLHLCIRQWASLEKCWSIITDMEPYTASSPAHSTRNIRRHKSNNSPRFSSPKVDLPKSYHKVSSEPGASTGSPWDHNHQKIFYFKSISCCDQTDRAIAHFIKLWLGFRSLGAGQLFTALPCSPLQSPELCVLLSTGQLLFVAWIFMRTKSRDGCCPGSKTTPNWCLLCDGFIMERHGGINHDWSSPGSHLTSLNCPELWHKSLLWIAIISPPSGPWRLAMWVSESKPMSSLIWVLGRIKH